MKLLLPGAASVETGTEVLLLIIHSETNMYTDENFNLARLTRFRGYNQDDNEEMRMRRARRIR